MAAMLLIRVDLPAPLSPTSAITSPARTSKSTSVSACTTPNDFETPLSSSVGEMEAPRWGASASVTVTRRTLSLAQLLVNADADLRLLQSSGLEEDLVVRLRDPDRLQVDGRNVADLVVCL